MFSRLLVCMLLVISVQSKVDIYDLLSSVGCGSFAGILDTTGYNYNLGSDHKGPYTVFAPSDAAFNNLSPELANIFNYGNWELMFDIISYHITNDVYLLASLQNNELIDTMLKNSQLRFNRYQTIQTISGGNITSPDNTATNGVVHVIDRVLYPLPEVHTSQYISENANLSTMALLMDKAGMHDALKAQNLTLFAPSDEAFKAAPKDFIKGLLINDTAIADFMGKYMVNSVYFSSNLINGQDLFTPSGNRIAVSVMPGNITVNGSGFTRTDLITMNGVVHIINKLFP